MLASQFTVEDLTSDVMQEYEQDIGKIKDLSDMLRDLESSLKEMQQETVEKYNLKRDMIITQLNAAKKRKADSNAKPNTRKTNDKGKEELRTEPKENIATKRDKALRGDTRSIDKDNKSKGEDNGSKTSNTQKSKTLINKKINAEKIHLQPTTTAKSRESSELLTQENNRSNKTKKKRIRHSQKPDKKEVVQIKKSKSKSY